MHRRICVTLTIVVLALSTSAFAQSYIPQCRVAKQTLLNAGQLATVGTLVSKACPQIHNGVWLMGSGTVVDVKTGAGAFGCDTAWANLNSDLNALNAGREFVTRNCPGMYLGLGWRQGPAAGAPVAICQQAAQSVAAAGVATQAGNALKFTCTQLYQNGWIGLEGGAPQACTNIWNILTAANQLPAVQTLVTYNCEWYYTNGFATRGVPLVQ